MMNIRVFLVDEQPIVRRGFELLLRMEPDLAFCGEAGSAPEALAKVADLRPDVVVLGLAFGSSFGMDLIKQIRARLRTVRILVFTTQSGAIHEERSFQAGADGYLTKDQGADKAIEAIRRLGQGNGVCRPSFAESLSAWSSHSAVWSPDSSPESLTDRELEVLEYLGQGLSSAEIAERLHVSGKTVQSHREHMKAKLRLKRASELVNYAHRWVFGK